MAEKRGSIAFSTTYRPPVPLDIFSFPLPSSEQDEPPPSKQDELPMTDGVNYNYNGQEISLAALKTILKREELASEGGKEAISGMVFVSERQEGLELLHIALRFNDNPYPPKVKVFCLADVFGKVNFSGVRMEDSGCIAGDNLVYVTTKDPAPDRRQPWTAVYKANLKTGKTDRLTPSGEADLSPSVQPSGKKIAVASFQRKPGGWHGEIDYLKTDIFVMNVEKPFNRKLVVRDGGWPTWGSDNVIFFHRKPKDEKWGVFRVDLSNSNGRATLVTPVTIDAMTPAAINDTTVAVATIREKSELSKFSEVRSEAQYRHIEIFSTKGDPVPITRISMPKADHFNPFVIHGVKDGAIDVAKRIGYHRCKSDRLKSGDNIERNSHKLDSPHQDVGLFRVSGIFPTFSNDGSKLAFVDNEFKAVWLANSEGLRIVYEMDENKMFSPVWNQNEGKDILYVNFGPAFNSRETLHICAIPIVSRGAQQRKQLTTTCNNAFPSTNPEGTKLVFRSTRDGGDKKYKNLYIMDIGESGYEVGEITRLTKGPWTDTHCQWSPQGDWIVFSSTRDKPDGAPDNDNELDPGYFAVFLVKWDDPAVTVRVMASGSDVAGHVNHPFFSPKYGKSIVVSADLAAVSVDPISLPLFVHSVRPYGDIFTFDIDLEYLKNINKNKNVKKLNKNMNVKKFNRITHSRYENSTATWTEFATQDPNAKWNMLLNEVFTFTPSCPYVHCDGGESWHMTGHLSMEKRCC